MDDKLMTLLRAEEQARELIERRQKELADVAESARRITEAEQALIAAREAAESERRRRSDVERKLQSQLEDAEKKREKGQRQLEQAMQRIDEAEARIEETQQAIAQSRDEGAAEREQHAEEAQRLQAKLEAERETHEREVAQHAETEQRVAKLQDELAAERAAAEARIAKAEGTLASLRGEQPESDTPAAAQPAERDRQKRASITGMLARKGRRGRRFIDRPGACAVCSRAYQADGPAEIASSGWIVRDDVGLCPDCQADRWQLPEGSQMPFRRFSERQPSA